MVDAGTLLAQVQIDICAWKHQDICSKYATHELTYATLSLVPPNHVHIGSFILCQKGGTLEAWDILSAHLDRPRQVLELDTSGVTSFCVDATEHQGKYVWTVRAVPDAMSTVTIARCMYVPDN